MQASLSSRVCTAAAAAAAAATSERVGAGPLREHGGSERQRPVACVASAERNRSAGRAAVWRARARRADERGAVCALFSSTSSSCSEYTLSPPSHPHPCALTSDRLAQEQLDRNGDGVISKSEFIAGYRAQRPPLQATARSSFISDSPALPPVAASPRSAASTPGGRGRRAPAEDVIKRELEAVLAAKFEPPASPEEPRPSLQPLRSAEADALVSTPPPQPPVKMEQAESPPIKMEPPESPSAPASKVSSPASSPELGTPPAKDAKYRPQMQPSAEGLEAAAAGSNADRVTVTPEFAEGLDKARTQLQTLRQRLRAGRRELELMPAPESPLAG